MTYKTRDQVYKRGHESAWAIFMTHEGKAITERVVCKDLDATHGDIMLYNMYENAQNECDRLNKVTL